jgi:hypothetical protein
MGEAPHPDDLRDTLESYHEQVILIMGFLGALLFAGLIFVIQSPSFITNSTTFTIAYVHLSKNSEEIYFQILITYLALVAGLSSITSIMSMRARTATFFTRRQMIRTYNLIDFCFALVFTLFMISFMLILIPINFWVGIAIGISLTLAHVFLMKTLRIIRRLP